MASHERMSGEVHDARNHSLAAGAIAQMEREQADVAPVPVAEPVASAPILETRHSKEVDGKKYIIDRGPDAPMFRTASDFETNVMAHAMPRIARLMSERDTGLLGAHSWRTKVEAAIFFKVKSFEAIAAKQPDLAEQYERAYQLDMYELLEASNQPFGDWRSDAPSPLLVGVK